MAPTSMVSPSDRCDIVLRWLKDNERGVAWLARKTGYTPSYLSRILHGRDPFTDKVAARLEETIAIDFAQELPHPQGTWETGQQFSVPYQT